MPDKPVPIVKAFEAVAVTVVEPPKLTDEPLIVMVEFVKALFAIPLNVPPNVKFPEVVTVPVKVKPFTVPVPPTDVTVPNGLVAQEVFEPSVVKYLPEFPI